MTVDHETFNIITQCAFLIKLTSCDYESSNKNVSIINLDCENFLFDSNDVKTQAFLAKTVETGDESATACFIVFSLFVKNAASCEELRLIRSSHLQR